MIHRIARWGAIGITVYTAGYIVVMAFNGEWRTSPGIFVLGCVVTFGGVFILAVGRDAR